MLRIYLHEGSHPQDICDYCCKQTGEEVICLQSTGRSWHDQQSIKIHTKCLKRQLDKLRIPPPGIHYESRYGLYLLSGLGRTRFARNRDYLARVLGRYIRRFGWRDTCTTQK